jgi:hypothetical protein
MKRSIVFAAMLILLSCVSAYSEMTVSDYEKSRNNDAAKLYVKGLSRGFDWYNIGVNNECGHRLYCPPDNLVLNSENYLRMLYDEITKWRDEGNRKPDEMYIEPLLLRGLMLTFPCKK